MAQMVLEVPDNWKEFLDDIAYCHREDPETYWGGEFVRMLKMCMESEPNALLYHLQEDLMEKHGIVLKS